LKQKKSKVSGRNKDPHVRGQGSLVPFKREGEERGAGQNRTVWCGGPKGRGEGTKSPKEEMRVGGEKLDFK